MGPRFCLCKLACVTSWVPTEDPNLPAQSQRRLLSVMWRLPRHPSVPRAHEVGLHHSRGAQILHEVQWVRSSLLWGDNYVYSKAVHCADILERPWSRIVAGPLSTRREKLRRPTENCSSASGHLAAPQTPEQRQQEQEIHKCLIDIDVHKSV